MGVRKRLPKAGRLSRFARGLRFDRNPLRRDTDRLETVAVAVLITDAQVANQATSGEAAGVIAVGTVLAVVGAGAFWTLNRRRMAAWDADWQATEPRWTTRA